MDNEPIAQAIERAAEKEDKDAETFESWKTGEESDAQLAEWAEMKRSLAKSMRRHATLIRAKHYPS
jgi:hypothetical protein